MAERFYGTDVTEDFDTIVEATRQEDGTLHLTAVVLDKRESGRPTQKETR